MLVNTIKWAPERTVINLRHASSRALQQEAGTGDDGNSRRKN